MSPTLSVHLLWKAGFIFQRPSWTGVGCPDSSGGLLYILLVHYYRAAAGHRLKDSRTQGVLANNPPTLEKRKGTAVQTKETLTLSDISYMKSGRCMN